MASRPVNDTATSPYAVLGVSRGASAEDIKLAYRKKAKAAHPDAGGSPAAMSRVNAAYQILSNPSVRRDYDHTQEAEAHPRSAASSGRASAAPTYRTPAHHDPDAARIDRERAAWARRSSWELMRFSAPLAAAATIVHVFLPVSLPGSAGVAFGIISFLPVYLFALSLVFLIDPDLRLVFADLARRHSTTQHERRGAVAVVLAFFPLVAIWAFWH